MSLKIASPLAALIGAALITACGGGSDDEATTQIAPPAGPEGLYEGKTGSADVVAVVLEDGRTYALYSTADGSDLGGVVVARGNASNGTYTSTVAKDFAVGEDVRSGSLTASYVAGTSFNGTFSAGGVSAPFTGTYNKAYELTPSLSTLAGVYDFALMASEGSTAGGAITITAAGLLSSSEPGCSTTGTVAPRAKGNVFDVTWTSTGVNCIFPGVALSGIGVYDADEKTLISVVHTADISTGVLAAGVKR